MVHPYNTSVVYIGQDSLYIKACIQRTIRQDSLSTSCRCRRAGLARAAVNDRERLGAPVLAGVRRVDTLVRAVDPAGGGALVGQKERVALGDDVELALLVRLDGISVLLFALEELQRGRGQCHER